MKNWKIPEGFRYSPTARRQLHKRSIEAAKKLRQLGKRDPALRRRIESIIKKATAKGWEAK